MTKWHYSYSSGEARRGAARQDKEFIMKDSTTTPEQQARDILERMEVPGAQLYSAGELVELANIIRDYRALKIKMFKLASLQAAQNEIHTEFFKSK